MAKYFVQAWHHIAGRMMLGSLDASSVDDAHDQVMNDLSQHGVSEEYIDRTKTILAKIQLKVGATISIIEGECPDESADFFRLLNIDID